MSKGNMLLGHARGKVGDLVFSRSNGQQVVRARAAVVKNPQTEKQQIQRIILNTVSQAYSRMSAITDHSFEGVQQGQKSMSFFMRRNLDMLRTRISEEVANGGELANVREFAPIGTNYFMPNAYIIASGSLPTVDVARVSGSVKSIAVAGNTYGDVIASLNLQRGDQLTFVCLGGNTIEKQTFAYARVILDPRDENDDALPLSTPFVADGAVVSPNPRNEGVFTSLSFADGALSFGLLPAGQIMIGVGVIVSRQNADGTWKRSNTQLAVADADVLLNGYSMQDALDMFAAGGFETNNALYLNNAGKSFTAAGLTAAGSKYRLNGVTLYVTSTNNVDVAHLKIMPKGGTVQYDISDDKLADKLLVCGAMSINTPFNTDDYTRLVLAVMAEGAEPAAFCQISRTGNTAGNPDTGLDLLEGTYTVALLGYSDKNYSVLENYGILKVVE